MEGSAPAEATAQQTAANGEVSSAAKASDAPPPDLLAEDPVVAAPPAPPNKAPEPAAAPGNNAVDSPTEILTADPAAEPAVIPAPAPVEDAAPFNIPATAAAAAPPVPEPTAAVPARIEDTAPATNIPATKKDTTPADAPPEEPAVTTTSKAPDVFPCIEQPIRVTLHCRNGYYLWGLRKGHVIARKKRNEKDEFRLKYIDAQAGIVEIFNHKYGGLLQVVVEEGGGGAAVKVVCVKDERDEVKKEEGENNSERQSQTNGGDTNDNSTRFANEEEEEFEDEPAVATNSSTSQKEDRQWCFVHGAGGEGVLLKSLRTGTNLAIDASGNVVLAGDERHPGIIMEWDMECVTGELCFLSNPRLEKRIRCDMAGLLSLTDAWKGWEVFRVMETGNHHYVKISSWMHSQWILCSTSDGTVTCCSHADSLLQQDESGRCSEWAIEKAPEQPQKEEGRGDLLETFKGVIVRSKTYGRLLCVRDGELRTHDPDAKEDEGTTDALLAVAAQQQSSESVRSTASTASAKDWWNNSVRSVNQSMRKVQKRLSQSSSGLSGKDTEEEIVFPQSETLVWQLESAHLQTYYFLNLENPKQPRSIGPFPYATSNLRQTDKIQLKRDAQSTKLFLTEKEQYISCSPEGNITLVFVYPDDDKNTEWIMEKPSYQEGGSVFRSKHYDFYLSYTLSNDGEEATVEEQPEPSESSSHFKNPFGGKPEPVAQLVGTEFIGPRAIWKLEPSTPRAVSSEKLKTFALGTGIAVGTTIAMPFALAGASAVLGAVGAEAGMLFNVIAAGLTGAEALASVGAIGATAYIVFRPEENSLTDDHKTDEEEGERAWSKRPFSNWRNW